ERRPLGALGRIGMVAGVHAAALYLIATSLGIVPPLISEPPEPLVLEPQDPVPPDPTPVPVQPNLARPDLTVPEPDSLPPMDSESTDRIVARIDDGLVVPPVAPPVAEPQLVGVRIDSHHPLTQPSYPPSDIRAGREGTAEIEVYVLPSGRVGDARIVKSAGSPTLDQSAIEEAKRRWRLLPATRDGTPYAQWHRLKVTFNLKNR
ncbi:MAG TPA: energy transducer TonB, partial [Steroidobacteraceae bacterium]